jgi:hypothetical protein
LVAVTIRHGFLDLAATEDGGARHGGSHRTEEAQGPTPVQGLLAWMSYCPIWVG